jgi:hypothetical protein
MASIPPSSYHASAAIRSLITVTFSTPTPDFVNNPNLRQFELRQFASFTSKNWKPTE